MVTEQERHLVERLERALPVRTKRMFGGVGIYSGEVFFALIAGDVLYFKVDDANRADYTARGLAPFQPFADRPTTMSYYEVPPDVVDDVRRLRPWIDGALAAARKKRASQATGTRAVVDGTRPRRTSMARASRGAQAATNPAAKHTAKHTAKKTAKKTARKTANRATQTHTRAQRRPAPIDDPRASGHEKIPNLGPVSMRWLGQIGVRSRADLEVRGSVAVFRELRERGIASSANLLYAMEAALLGLRWDRLPDVVKRNLRERAGIASVR